jgi:ATP-dependent Lhr-like helicase
MTTVAAYDDFPMLLETWRTCLEDEFDLDALETMLTELADGLIGWTHVTGHTPSPFSANITFDQINRYMYADDSPEAPGPSSLSDRLISDALAHESLRPRLTAATIASFEEKRQRRHPDYAPSEPADWQEWVKERILIPSAEYDGPDDGLMRITTDDRSWIVHPEVLFGLVQAGMLDAKDVKGPIATVADPRSATQFASEILSFYGPVSADTVARILPRVPEDLFADEEAWVRGHLVEGSETPTYCDATNYEILLRFQRAALRPDVQAKPVDSLPGFLARWQAFDSEASVDNLADCLIGLRGYSASVKTWLTDFLPARFPALEDTRVDEALQTAELAWFGTGTETMTVAYPEDAALIMDLTNEADAMAAMTSAFTDPTARYSFSQLAESQSEPLDAFCDGFWSAVWAGVIHADTLTPLRQGLVRGFKLNPLTAGHGSMRRGRRGARRGEPRSFSGNWLLTRLEDEPDDPLTALETDKDRARLLLDRYGFLSRELANREGGRLRWAKLFRALCMMELAGEIVSGYFFEHLSGPQFMAPAALQSFSREAPPKTFWVNATDPVAPSGLGLHDPRLPHRRPQNYLSYLDDELALVVENLGRRLSFHLPPDHPRLVEAMEPLAHLVRRERRVAVATINDEDARKSPYLEAIGTIVKGVKDHKQIILESK